MPTDARVWRVTEGDRLEEMARSRLSLESRLENWLAEDIGILSPDLLVIGRQVKTAHGGFIDLLCVEANGDLKIVELKRDKTPREIVSQALDYASWIVDLSHEKVTDLANEYFENRGTNFESAFRERFQDEIPEVLNEDHGIIVVGSEIDESSERIIRYLSERHQVNINAASFGYLRAKSGGGEFLSRVFLLEPSEVLEASTSGSKRAPNLTLAQLTSIASERGVKALFEKVTRDLNQVLARHTTRTGFVLDAIIDESRKAVVNLIPGESAAESGVAFHIYSHRLAALLKTDAATVEAQLPAGAKPWKYYPTASDDYAGAQGFFSSAEEIDRFVNFLKGNLK